MRQLSFVEKLQQIRDDNRVHPVVAHVRRWLEFNRHRLVPVLMHENKAELLEPDNLPTGKVRPVQCLPRSKFARVHEVKPATPPPIAGFRVYEEGRLMGFYVWPGVFNSELVPHGSTSILTRKKLAALGLLMHRYNRLTCVLPQPIKLAFIEGSTRTHTYRVVGLRGFDLRQPAQTGAHPW
ncbi:hypothetical protein ACFORG_14890 [Lutimaribacter marinistellae]|uniref:Uncharacterized protein n=1 Tax=Lutimaribacter marinistellae TaxID=1820329 RepID=A0ABV7TLM2_9RHOB